MSEPATVAQKESESKTAWQQIKSLNPRWVWFFVVILVALFLYSQTQFWKRPSGGDRANWDYMAQVIVRGGLPYRDAVNIKSPLSAYIGAAAITLARPFGLRDVLAIRVMFIMLAAITVALTFLVTLEYFEDMHTALLAATIMFTFHVFSGLNASGVQPKTPMILFGLLTLRAILKDRPFEAGVLGMLSALSWQPGLLFAGCAALAHSRYFTNWRDRKIVKLILGAAIPLLVMLGYFLMMGALRDFYIWNVHFNATVYGPGETRELSDFFDHFSTILYDSYRQSRIYFYLAVGGLFIAAWKLVASGIKLGGRGFIDSAPKHAIIIAPIVYFAFCMINIQGSPDIIPMLPFVAAFAAVAIMFAIRREASLIRRVWPKIKSGTVESWAAAAIVALILYFNVLGPPSGQPLPSLRFIRRPNPHTFPTLADQDLEVASIVSQLGPGDKIYVHGRTEILVLSGLTNASKYFLFDRGKDNYLDYVEPGGFEGWLQRMKAERPKIVVLNRPSKVDRFQDLENWVAQDYEAHVGPIFTYWLRKESNQ